MFAATPLTPVVPLPVQHAIAKANPQTAYVPTKLPTGYRYISWHHGRSGFDIYFGPSSRPVLGFDAARNPCAAYGHPTRTFHIDGVTVYWAGTYEDQQAWRCVTRGRVHIGLQASRSIPGAESPRDALVLARVVASARRIG